MGTKASFKEEVINYVYAYNVSFLLLLCKYKSWYPEWLEFVQPRQTQYFLKTYYFCAIDIEIDKYHVLT